MLFNSGTFFVFFSILVVLLLIIQHFPIYREAQRTTIRNGILLFASYFFYAFLHWEFLILLFFTTIVNYFSAIKISEATNGGNERNAKIWMWVAVSLSIGVLAYFKYVNFFIDSVNFALMQLGMGTQVHLIRVLLPVGISFFTFQALTYTLDVYKEKMEVRKNFVNVALFISFFPTILSGPIERARNLIPQLEKPGNIALEQVLEGGKLFLWGLFKKMIIADRLGDYVDAVYCQDISSVSSVTFIITSVFYSFQIYADFSGYTDMAIGVARVMGFKLGINFNYPYFSTSIKEFWKKWHISLTSWFSEYVYIPLGGNRVKQSRYLFNISTVFLLSGLWHGANWAFIVWGGLHAVYYIIEFYYKKTLWYKKLPSFWGLKLLSMLLVFILVTIAWIFFRTEDTVKSLNIITSFFTHPGVFYWGSSAFSTVLTILLLCSFCFLDWIRYKGIRFNSSISAFGYAFILGIILLCSVSNSGFVYFQF